jgi:hypothetical protein
LRRATSASQSTPKNEQGSGDAEGEEIMTRTHRAFRIDIWTDDEKEVVEHLADVEDLTVALATYHAACKRWPGKAITLRHGAHVVEDSRRSRLAVLFSFPWSDKPSD